MAIKIVLIKIISNPMTLKNAGQIKGGLVSWLQNNKRAKRLLIEKYTISASTDGSHLISWFIIYTG